MQDKERHCEFIEKCPFFNTLHSDSAVEILKTYYCKTRYHNCERYKLRNAGEEVPGDLWPNGFSRSFSSSQD